MKTLTVTFHYTPNYGAVLQAYALQQTILSMGHENKILDIVKCPPNKKHFFSLNALIRSLFMFVTYCIRKKKVARLWEHFSNFQKKHLILTQPYMNMEEIRNGCIDADCLITGSDQVWNFKTRPQFIEARLLKFGKIGARRFSYAASMEKTDLSQVDMNWLTTALLDFSGISLREEKVRALVQSLTSKKCIRVLDPVFLLSQEKWNSIAIEPRFKGDYILCYQVVSNKNLPWFAKKLSKQTGLPIISICCGSFRWFNADYSYFDVSIEEFLGFYKNASYILSASFHGVAMGLVYDKPVYAFVKEYGGNRLREIMSLFSLEKYLVDNRKKLPPLYVEDDLKNVKAVKKMYKDKSFSFLNDMLNYV